VKRIYVSVVLALLVVGAAALLSRARAAGAFCCNADTGKCGTDACGGCSPPGSPDVGTCHSVSNTLEIVFPSGGSPSMTLNTQNVEPPEGFTGACLRPYTTHLPQLPTVCYSPSGGVDYSGANPDLDALVIAPSKTVWRPQQVGLALPTTREQAVLAPDFYWILQTCGPHLADGKCPADKPSISRSCCTIGGNLISLDGHFAQGRALSMAAQ
jgi:hypothetical protein